MSRFAALLTLAALAAGVMPAHAAPPRIAFAGRLRTSAGPVSGPVSVTFAIYDAPDGGDKLWAETQALEAQDGVLLADLGAQTTLDESVFAGDARFLAIAVDGELLAPRVPVLSVPFAFRAATADTLGALGEADVQRRVGQACPAGQAMRAIDAAGKPACQVPPGLAPCAWEKETNAASAASVAATCPAGRHAVSGGCDAAGAENVAFTGPSPLPGDGADATKAVAWKCQFSAAAVGHTALALCCGVN